MFRQVLGLVLLLGRTSATKDIELLVGDRATQFWFLIRDRDSKFTAAFDAVFESADIRIIRTPARAPRANAIAERWIGTLRRECLDHLLITGPRHLAAVLREYVDHFNSHRPHRSLHQHPPACHTPPQANPANHVLRRDRLGGLVHEYVQDAPMDRQASLAELPAIVCGGCAFLRLRSSSPLVGVSRVGPPHCCGGPP